MKNAKKLTLKANKEVAAKKFDIIRSKIADMIEDFTDEDFKKDLRSLNEDIREIMSKHSL